MIMSMTLWRIVYYSEVQNICLDTGGSQKEYRDVLFEFLHHNVDEITQVAWNFIMKLPTNPDDLESIFVAFKESLRLIGVKYLAQSPCSGWFIICKS